MRASVTSLCEVLPETENERQRTPDGLVIELRNERASFGAAPDTEQAQLLERAISLAHRDAARLELAGHVTLGRQLVAGGQAPIGYLFLDASGDRVRHPVACVLTVRTVLRLSGTLAPASTALPPAEARPAGAGDAARLVRSSERQLHPELHLAGRRRRPRDAARGRIAHAAGVEDRRVGQTRGSPS